MSTDRQRMTAALESLADAGIVHVLDLTGSTGVREDDLDDYLRAAARAGTNRWAGAHVGAREHDGAFWDEQGVLRYRFNNEPVPEVWWSWNHHVDWLAAEVEEVFTAAGFTLLRREATDAVHVVLGGGR